LIFREGKTLLSNYAESTIGKISKSESLQSLRILIEIAKNDAARHRSSLYEPFLTKMIEQEIVCPIVLQRKTSRLLS
jgi:hypothetical protein